MLLLGRHDAFTEATDAHTVLTPSLADLLTANIHSDGTTDDSAAWTAYFNAITNGTDPHHMTIVKLPSNASTGGSIVNGNMKLVGKRFVEVRGQSTGDRFKFKVTNRQTNTMLRVGGQASPSVGCILRYLHMDGALVGTLTGTDSNTYAIYQPTHGSDGDSAFRLGSNAINCQIIDCDTNRSNGDGFTVGDGGAGKPGAVGCSIIRCTDNLPGRCGIGAVNFQDLYVEDFIGLGCGTLWIDLEADGDADITRKFTLRTTAPGKTQAMWQATMLHAGGVYAVDDIDLQGIEIVSFNSNGSLIVCNDSDHTMPGGLDAQPRRRNLRVDGCFIDYRTATPLVTARRTDGLVQVTNNAMNSSSPYVARLTDCQNYDVSGNTNSATGGAPFNTVQTPVYDIY